MNSIIELTTDILNSKGRIALVGKIFQDIGAGFRVGYGFEIHREEYSTDFGGSDDYGLLLENIRREVY